MSQYPRMQQVRPPSTNLSPFQIVDRIQQTAVAPNGQQFTGQELVDVLATMYSASSVPERRGAISCVYQVPPPITSLTWAPDGKRVALSHTQTVMICGVEKREILATFSPHVFPPSHGTPVTVTNVAFSPDGKWIALSRSDREIEVVDVTAGTSFLYQGHFVPVQAVAWSHNGDYLASSDSEGCVHVWSFGGTLAFDYTIAPDQHALTPIRLLWSTDDKQVVSWCDNHVNYLSNLKDLVTCDVPQIIKAIVQSSGTWYVAAATKNTHAVDIGSLQYSTSKWSAKRVHTYARHRSPVRAVAFSPDGKCVASSSDDLTIQVWNTHDGNDVFTFRIHPAPVRFLSWSPTGKYIASADDQGIVLIWQAE